MPGITDKRRAYHDLHKSGCMFTEDRMARAKT